MRVKELIRNTTLAVGTTPTIVADEQFGTQRSVLFITNTSTAGQTVSLSVGDEAVAGEGIVLGAGGFYQDSRDAGYRPSNRRVTAVASAADAAIAIHERIVMREV